MTWDDRATILTWAKEKHPVWWRLTCQQDNDPEALDAFLLRLAEHLAKEAPELARTLSFDVWKYLRQKGLLKNAARRSKEETLPFSAGCL